MDKKNSEKTAAELYREERKKRLEKAAKKNSKNTPELAQFKRGLSKFVAIVLVAAIVLGCLYGVLSFFGVPQKALTVSTVDGGSMKSAKNSVAKFNYYYVYTYQQMANTAYQYDQQYGEGMGKMYTGFDYTLAPDVQEYTTSTLEGFEDGQTAYWSDYLRITVLKNLKETAASYMEAVNAGYKLTEEQQKDIDDTIAQFRDAAKESDFSLNRFLIYRFGKGVDEKLLREILEENQVAQSYLTDKYNEIKDAQTDDAVEKEFKENIKDYGLVSLRYFVVSSDAEITDEMTDDEKQAAQDAANEKAKKTADAALKTITDEESFLAAAKAAADKATSFSEESTLLEGTTYSSLQSTFGTNTADWAFDGARKVGESAVIEGNDKYIVAFMVKLPYKDETVPVNVRHILFQFATDSNGTVTMTDDEKAELKKQAEDVLAQFNENPSEDAFIELAAQYSEDEGSKNNGGLIENITPTSNYVTNFRDWAVDKSRKVGDAEIVETEYGYHIMYFSGKSDKAVWYETVQTALADTQFENEYNDMLAKHPTKENAKIIDWGMKIINKHINDYWISH